MTWVQCWFSRRSELYYRFVSRQFKIKTIFDIFVWIIKHYNNTTGEFGHALALPYVHTSQTSYTRYNFNFVDYSSLEFMTKFSSFSISRATHHWNSWPTLLILFRGLLTTGIHDQHCFFYFAGYSPLEFMTNITYSFSRTYTTGIPLEWPNCLMCCTFERHFNFDTSH